MAAGEGNVYKDETPAQLAARKAKALAAHNVQKGNAKQAEPGISTKKVEQKPTAGKSGFVDSTK